MIARDHKYVKGKSRVPQWEMATVCVLATEKAFYEEVGFRHDQEDKEPGGGGGRWGNQIGKGGTGQAESGEREEGGTDRWRDAWCVSEAEGHPVRLESPGRVGTGDDGSTSQGQL